MKKTTILLIATSLLFTLSTKSQNISESSSSSIIENAKYLNGDLTELLSSKVRYPKEGAMNNIQGDVIVSFVISKNGTLDSLVISLSPDISLSTASILSMNFLEDKWSPCIMGNDPIDKKYCIVFRYRMYLDAKPPSNENTAVKAFEKQKFEKSLKLYNKAIKDNQYDSKLYDSRSIVKEIIGDHEGAKQDQLTSFQLKNEVIAIINVIAIGVTRTRQVRY